MATRGQLVTWLRRRLQEVSPAQWTDSTLQSYVNEGYREVGEAIKDVDPEWLVWTDAHDIISGQDLYKFPSNMDSIICVWYRGSATADYVVVENRRRKLMDDDVSSSTVSYSVKGRNILLSPAPTSNITLGLKLDYVPVPSLGEDTAVPELPASLHKGIVYAAQILALGDTSETTDKAAVREELDRFLVRAKQVYETNRDSDEYVTPDNDLKMYPEGYE